MVKDIKLKLACKDFPEDTLIATSTRHTKLNIAVTIPQIDSEWNPSVNLDEAGIAKLRKFLNQNFDINGNRKKRQGHD